MCFSPYYSIIAPPPCSLHLFIRYHLQSSQSVTFIYLIQMCVLSYALKKTDVLWSSQNPPHITAIHAVISWHRIWRVLAKSGPGRREWHTKCTFPERDSNPLAQVARDPVVHEQPEVLMLFETSVFTVSGAGRAGCFSPLNAPHFKLYACVKYMQVPIVCMSVRRLTELDVMKKHRPGD
jgi:hypothetical protein